MNKIKEIQIYDLDGTVIDSSHRYRHLSNGKIDLDYWRANECHADKDTLLPLAEQYEAHCADPSVYVVVATSRVMGEKDWAFVNENLSKPNQFISRKAGDDRKGGFLKIAGLRKVFNLKQFRDIPAKFWEDDLNYLTEVCDAYKNVEPCWIFSNQS